MAKPNGLTTLAAPVAHPTVKCCWCQGPLWLFETGHYWCQTPACVKEQMRFAIGVQPRGGSAAVAEWAKELRELDRQHSLDRDGVSWRGME